MRILIISDHIHFGGGGDAVLRLERQAYEKVGYEVFTFSQSSKVEEFATASDFICRESERRLVNKIGKFIAAPHVYESLKRVLQRTRPDLIRVHLVSKYPASIYHALEGQNVIQTLHGPNLFCATSWGNLKIDSSDCELGIGLKCWRRGCTSFVNASLYSWLDYRTQSQVKKVVKLFHCPSKQIELKAKTLGYGPTVHIPLGIDKEFMSVEAACHEGPPRLLYVGALVQEKGLLTLPDALQLIKQQVKNVKLILCGRGVLESRLRQEFFERDLSENVEFKGFVPHSEVVKYFKNADVFVLPSIWAEQFGLVGPEALACGVPCVASQVGGVPEWLHDGKWGYLVPPRDPVALADPVVRLLKDRMLRLEFGAAGRAFARQIHSSEVYQQSWLELAGHSSAN